jgi:hypothetical protein
MFLFNVCGLLHPRNPNIPNNPNVPHEITLTTSSRLIHIFHPIYIKTYIHSHWYECLARLHIFTFQQPCVHSYVHPPSYERKYSRFLFCRCASTAARTCTRSGLDVFSISSVRRSGRVCECVSVWVCECVSECVCVFSFQFNSAVVLGNARSLRSVDQRKCVWLFRLDFELK